MSEDARRYAREIVLRDGTPLHLRAMRPGDKTRVADLYGRLSPASRYHRFLRPKRTLTEKELVYLTEPDFERHVALVATRARAGSEKDGETLIGMGRYVELDAGRDASPRTAEVAFAVEDAWQGKGLGTILLEHLAVIARSRGIAAFAAEVLGDNRQMMDVFVQSGFKVKRTVEKGVVHVTFPIEETEAFMAAHAARASDGPGEAGRARARE